MGKKSEKEEPQRLGEKLAAVRNSLGLSQNAMLRHLGVNEIYTREEISAYERGVRHPPLHILLKYSKVARVWINVLVDDELDLPAILPSRNMHGGIRHPTTKSKS